MRGHGPGLIFPALERALLDGAPLVLITTFFFVGSVSKTTFEAFLCKEYDVDSDAGTTRSFLIADLTVECNTAQHEGAMAMAYVFIAIWPVGVVAAYVGLLALCWPTLRAHETSDLTRATKFLHGALYILCFIFYALYLAT